MKKLKNLSGKRKILYILIVLFLAVIAYFVYSVLIPVKTEGTVKEMREVPYIGYMFQSLGAEDNIRYYVWNNRLRGEVILLLGNITKEKFDNFFSGWSKQYFASIEEFWNIKINLLGLKPENINIDISEDAFCYFKNISTDSYRIVNIYSIYNEKQEKYIIIVETMND